jgi:hypothetical protein
LGERAISEAFSKALDEPKPRDLTYLVLHVDQQLGEPPRKVAGVKPSDQLGAVRVGSLEDVEQLTGALLA